MNTYPIIRFTARHGAAISWLACLTTLVASAALAVAFSSTTVMVVGAALSVVTLAVLYSYTELVRVIADTLLPR